MKFAITFLLASALAFGAHARDARTLRAQIERILPSNTELSANMITYLANEAARVGVRKIGFMTKSQVRRDTARGQLDCAQTILLTRKIRFDPSRASCTNPHTLIHEIAHVAAIPQFCFGHGDNFYRANYRLAQRFEAAFPQTKKWKRRPTSDVIRKSKIYRTEDHRCKGGKPFP